MWLPFMEPVLSFNEQGSVERPRKRKRQPAAHLPSGALPWVSREQLFAVKSQKPSARYSDVQKERGSSV